MRARWRARFGLSTAVLRVALLAVARALAAFTAVTRRCAGVAPCDRAVSAFGLRGHGRRRGCLCGLFRARTAGRPGAAACGPVRGVPVPMTGSAVCRLRMLRRRCGGVRRPGEQRGVPRALVVRPPCML